MLQYAQVLYLAGRYDDAMDALVAVLEKVPGQVEHLLLYVAAATRRGGDDDPGDAIGRRLAYYERERLRSLEATRSFGTPTEACYDAITSRLARALRAPAAPDRPRPGTRPTSAPLRATIVTLCWPSPTTARRRCSAAPALARRTAS